MIPQNRTILCFSVFLMASVSGAAQNFTWVGADGNWSDTSSWLPLGDPDGPNSDIVIAGDPDSVTVTLDGNRTIGSAIIGNKDTLAISPFRKLQVAGPVFDNDGFLHLAGVNGLNATLQIDSPHLQFVGSGTTSTTDSSGNRVLAGTAGNQVTIGPDYTYRGSGRLGNASGLGIINEGLIEATETDHGLIVSPGSNANLDGPIDLINQSGGVIRSSGTGGMALSGGNWRNQGLIEADQGGDLSLDSIFLDNASGVLRQGVSTSSFVIGDSVIVREGALVGVIDVEGVDVVLSDVAIESNDSDIVSLVRIKPEADVVLDGTIHFASTESTSSKLAVFGDIDQHNDVGIDEEGVVLSGRGTLSLDQAFSRVVNDAGPSSPNALTINSGITIEGGRGELGANDNLGVINRGHVETRLLGDFVINTGAGADVQGQVDFLNEGILSSTGTGTALSLRNGTYQNDGVIGAYGGNVNFEASTDLAHQVGVQLRGGVWEATSNGVLALSGPTIFELGSDAEVSISGKLSDITAGGGQGLALTVNVNHGIFRLLDGKDSAVTAGLTNYGTLELGAGSDYTAAVSSVFYTQMNDATLSVQIAGTDEEAFGQIDVTGQASLGGNLEVSVLDGYVPNEGDTFALIRAAGGVSGVFDSLIQPIDMPTGLAFELMYLRNLVELTVIEANLLAGDYNASGLVEQGDLDQVLQNWGQGFASIPGTWINQRPTDGIVDQAELDVVLQNWGGASAPDFAGRAVPEPATAVFLAGLLVVHRRRSCGR